MFKADIDRKELNVTHVSYLSSLREILHTSQPKNLPLVDWFFQTGSLQHPYFCLSLVLSTQEQFLSRNRNQKF